MGRGVAVNAPGVLTGLGPGVQVDVITLLYPFSAVSEEGLRVSDKRNAIGQYGIPLG